MVFSRRILLLFNFAITLFVLAPFNHLLARPCSPLLAQLTKLKSVRVAVVGDVMLDRLTYVIDRNKISPESTTAKDYLWHSSKSFGGGAANVALNLKKLGAEVYLFSVVGRDAAWMELSALLEKERIITSLERNLLILEDSRLTTVKDRTILRESGEHIHRISREDTSSIMEESQDEIIARLNLRRPQVIILSDYAKGVVTPELSQRVIEWAKKNGSIVIVDPKGRDFKKYNGAYLIKPNRSELEEWARKNIPDSEIFAQLERLKFNHRLQMAMATLSHSGMVAIDSQNERFTQPSVVKDLRDVTGAGDSTTAALALAIAAGFSTEQSLLIASHAAAVAVSQMGTYAVTFEDLEQSIKEGSEHTSPAESRVLQSVR
jgi:D-beta-D-heptose 7-phosphate kinase / D-beta-D-heptose 1-phosphate adenosyltransferase